LNNGFLCGLLLGSTDEQLAKRAVEKMSDPFIGYNTNVFTQTPRQLKTLALFENYRFGLPSRKENTLTLGQQGRVQEWKDPVITFGRLDDNRICLEEVNVSRRHCAIVNSLDDLWIHDLGSTHGVFVDGKKIDRKAYLEGVHVLKLGQTELILCSKLGLLV
jgi:FHA domain